MKDKQLYRLTLKQLMFVSVVSALVAVVLVVGYQRLAEKPVIMSGAPVNSSEPTPPPENSVLIDDERNNIEVYKAVSPGVVNIRTVTMVQDFFSVYPEEGGGSGSIINEQGYILTNHHVVEGAQRLSVTLADGSEYKAKLIGGDPDTDLAIIKIDAPREKLTVVKLGDSERLAVGQKVLAIGNPFGIGQTLTRGIISALGRPIRAENDRLIEGAIQTDASINPGNSGGPLLNSRGEMIGVNSQIISPSRGSVGIGFAIPVNLAKRIVPDLIAHGRAIRPWLGIIAIPIPVSALVDQVDLPVKSGVLISEVYPGETADNAGLRGGRQRVRVGRGIYFLGGDIIYELDGQRINTLDDINRVVNQHRPGETISAVIYRGSQRLTVRLKLTEKPANPQ